MSSLWLFINNSFLVLRSRKGFLVMMALFRLLAGFGILLVFAIPTPSDFMMVIYHISFYILFSLILLIILFFSKSTYLSKTYIFLSVFFDTAIILYFLYSTNSLQSEIYLLLLLPLVSIAHFIERKIALFYTSAVILGFGFVLYLIQLSSTETVIFSVLYQFLLRSSFLLLSTWIYRFSRTFPTKYDTYSIGPKKARELIEQKLNVFRKVLYFDSASVQLLYKKQLCIVACVGFQDKNEIYKMEFPIENQNYPNYFVMNNLKPFLTNTDDFRSFAIDIFQANNIEQWLGIPLISPATQELLGMVAFDSKKKSRFLTNDVKKAKWFVNTLADFVTDLPLGPAALTQSLSPLSFENLVSFWKENFFSKNVNSTDDFDLSKRIVDLANKMFYTEDCSLFISIPIYRKGPTISEKVLQLIASTNIPKEEYSFYTTSTKGGEMDGLISHAFFTNSTINYSWVEMQEDIHFSDKYSIRKKHFDSKKLNQIMICPIRESNGNPMGVLKIENKKGWASENRFPFLEQLLFESFCFSMGLLLNNLRLKNYDSRKQSEIHNVKSTLEGEIIVELDQLIAKHCGYNIEMGEKDIEKLSKGLNYVKGVLSALTIQQIDHLTLESKGVLPALEEYCEGILIGLPNLAKPCRRIRFRSNGIPDNLNLNERDIFYRIGREAIFNSLQYSNIESSMDGFIEVYFENINEKYKLRILDNGCGFEVSELEHQNTRFGTEEILKLKTQLERKSNKEIPYPIISELGKGTTVEVIYEKGKTYD